MEAAAASLLTILADTEGLSAAFSGSDHQPFLLGEDTAALLEATIPVLSSLMVLLIRAS